MEKAGGKSAPVFSYMTFFNNLTVNGGQFNEIFPNPTRVYYLVAAEALPEIFIRVAEAKRMMQTGEADTVGAATKMAGISRSAFYKYKDAVQPFNDMKSEHIITFYTLLKDVSGTLSSVLGVFAASAETSAMENSLEQLITDVSALDNVIKFEILAG